MDVPITYNGCQKYIYIYHMYFYVYICKEISATLLHQMYRQPFTVGWRGKKPVDVKSGGYVTNNLIL